MNKETFKKEAIEIAKFIGIIVLIYLAIVGAFRYLPFLNKYQIFVIRTDSMVPVLNVSDIVIVDNSIEPNEVKVGDIMAFRVDITGDSNDDVVVHYIDEIRPFGDELIYKTISAKSGIQDSWTLEEEDLIGVYTFRIEYFGKFILFVQSWIGKVIILADIIILSFVYDFFFKKPKEEEKDSVISDESKEVIKEIHNDMDEFMNWMEHQGREKK